jgi:hypothetical protein
MPFKSVFLGCVICAVIALHCGCRKSPVSSGEESRAFKKPSATEIFNLRSKCADLGAKMLQDDGGGVEVLNNDPKRMVFVSREQTSYYNPNTNRCYVEMYSNKVSPKYDDMYSMRAVYDGQTGELLADTFTRQNNTISFVKDGKANDIEAAQAKMDSLMADDRKQ